MSIRDRFEWNKRFEIENVEPAIPEEVYVLINNKLYNEYDHRLPAGFDYRWLVPNEGTFPKRVSAYFHDEFSINLPDSTKEWIGKTARDHTLKLDKVNYDFTQCIDWDSGAYGDSGSCYWGCKKFARAMLIYNGSAAIRFYNDQGKGWGRAWIHFSDQCLFISNAYPKGFALDQVAMILSRHFGLEWKPITLLNQNEWEGILHINQGRGIVLYPHASPFEACKHDLMFPTFVKCSCGRKIESDAKYWKIISGKIICSKCLEALYFYCGMCEKTLPIDSRHGTVDNCLLCKSCYEALPQCTECGERSANRRYGLCHSCFTKHYAQCARCRDYFKNEEFVTAKYNGNLYCKECYDRIFSGCAQCGAEAVKHSTNFTFEGAFLCEECRAKSQRCRNCGRLHMRGQKCGCSPKHGQWEIKIETEEEIPF